MGSEYDGKELPIAFIMPKVYRLNVPFKDPDRLTFSHLRQSRRCAQYLTDFENNDHLQQFIKFGRESYVKFRCSKKLTFGYTLTKF